MGKKANPLRGQIQSYISKKIIESRTNDVWITLNGSRALITSYDPSSFDSTKFLVSFDGDYRLVELSDKDSGIMWPLDNKEIKNCQWKKLRSFKIHATLKEIYNV